MTRSEGFYRMRGVGDVAIITEKELTSELVIGGLRYWESKRNGNPIPARGDFDRCSKSPRWCDS